MAIILITGASGFLGKVITRELLFQKYQIFTLGRQLTNDIVCDLSFGPPVINLKCLDFVIHAAGMAHSIPKTIAEKQIFLDINLGGTNSLLKSLESLEELPKGFVFISSVSVYGLEKGINVDEGTQLKARDSYGLSKSLAEQTIKDWCKKNNVICTILRLPLLVGEKPPGNLGAMIRAIRNGYYFNVGGGKAKKSMVLVEDVARFIIKIATIGGTYNLTDGEHPTFRDLSFVIAKKKCYTLPIIFAKVFGFLGDFLGDFAPINSLKIKKITSDLTFDDSKAREFGWEPQSVIEYLKNNNL
jgi:nucleoside-diphosphate-sugar epimerase